MVSLALLFPHNLIIDICTGGIPRVTFSTQPHNWYLYRWFPSRYFFHTTSKLTFSTQHHNWYLYRWYPLALLFPHNLIIHICTGGIPRVTFSTQPHNSYLYRWYPSRYFFPHNPHNWYLYRWYPSRYYFHTTSKLIYVQVVSLALLFPHKLIIDICTGGIPRVTFSTQPHNWYLYRWCPSPYFFPHKLIIDISTGGITRVTFSTQPHNWYLYRWYPSRYFFHTTSSLISVQVVSLALLFPHNLIIDICTGGITRVTFSTQPHNWYLYRWYPSPYFFHTNS